MRKLLINLWAESICNMIHFESWGKFNLFYKEQIEGLSNELLNNLALSLIEDWSKHYNNSTSTLLSFYQKFLLPIVNILSTTTTEVYSMVRCSNCNTKHDFRRLVNDTCSIEHCQAKIIGEVTVTTQTILFKDYTQKVSEHA